MNIKSKGLYENKRILKVIILYLITPHFLRMRKYIFFNFTHNLFFLNLTHDAITETIISISHEGVDILIKENTNEGK